MIIYGKNPVSELLLNPSSEIEEIFLYGDDRRSNTSEILNAAKGRGIRISNISKEDLSKLCQSTSHQGIAARIKDFKYHELADTISQAKERGDHLCLVILDHIEDPQNLGAIIRTVDVLGAHGVVVPKDRAAPVTPAVVKASAGAVNHVPISRVVNLNVVIRDLKKQGVWIVGADSSSSISVNQEDFKNLDIALVIGNEGRGIGHTIKKECDFLVSIPQSGVVSSLNASVAAGIMIYEIMRQRLSTSDG